MLMKKTKLDHNFFRELDTFYKDYELRDSEENLNELLNVYQRIQPDWVERFNELHQKLLNENKIKDKTFNDFLVVQLPKKYTVQNLKVPKNKNSDPFVDVMQRGRIIHLANKIAHCFERIFDRNLKKYMKENGLDSISKNSFEEVKKLVKKVYTPTTKEEVTEEAKTILQEKYGFAKVDFEEGKNLDTLKFPELIKAYDNGMYIKDREMISVNNLVQFYGLEDVSYGVKREGEEDLFVMDIQGFGQFSVHMVEKDLVSQIKAKYKMPIYRMETATLVNHMSDDAKEFMQDAKEDDSMDDERDISNSMSELQKQRVRLLEELKFLDLTKAEKHELGVKGGLTRKELQELDDAKEERE